ncbi:phage terminase small subunit P27 family [Hoeflea sp. CAU 1731]
MKGAKPQLRTDRAALASVPRPPAWLAKDAKAEWRRTMPLLVERRILTDADLGTLESYCTAVARIREAERTIANEGSTYMSTSGPKRHPAVTIQDAAMKTARLCAAELGLTPVSRSRPTIRDDEDDADSLLD